MSNTEAVRSILAVHPEYKGMWLFSLTDLARIYTRGNQKRMRAFLSDAANVIPPHYIGSKSHPLYCIIDVQEAVSKTRWKEE